MSQRYHLTLSFRFHSFHVTFIYTMNWMIFYFVWFVFLLFSFDVIIIAPPNAFVNTFLCFSHNYYSFHYLQCIYIMYFLYYILFSDIFILLRLFLPVPILINRQDAIHAETANTHEYCVMWYMLSFCHQARCLSVSEFERLADYKRMYHIADAMVFAGLYGWRPVVFIYIYPLL